MLIIERHIYLKKSRSVTIMPMIMVTHYHNCILSGVDYLVFNSQFLNTIHVCKDIHFLVFIEIYFFIFINSCIIFWAIKLGLQVHRTLIIIYMYDQSLQFIILFILKISKLHIFLAVLSSKKRKGKTSHKSGK